jgi:S1-C subfamily serine protease
MNSTRKLIRGAAAVALALPLGVASVAAPAVAARTVLADHRSPFPLGYGGYGGYGGFGYGGTAPQQPTAYASLDAADATAVQSSGLVEITSTLEYGEGEAAGTGIVLDGDGLVVTNHHVVEGATQVTVTVPGTGTEHDAEVLGYDATKDVAVLRLVDASGLATATADPGGVATADPVTAVGDAGGDGGSLTAAPGTVSDLHRPITVADDTTGEDVRLRNLIEVTSDVVPGDSGGALLDGAGAVVGMTVAASSGSSDVTGYVIPIGRVLRVVDEVLAGNDSGTVVVGSAAFLGVQLSSGAGTATLAGVLADGPAEAAGLVAGDTVTAVGGQSVSTADQLRTAVAGHQPGERIAVTWTDPAGADHTATVTLAAGPVG